MQIQIVLLATCATIALTSAHGYGYGDDNGQASYSFDYAVRDPETQDVKSQFERREGDQVIGQYALQEPDGTQRIVRYRSDPRTGFEAVVERRGEAQHSQFGQSFGGGYAHPHQHYGGGFGGGLGGSSHVGTTRWGNQGGHGY